jgi:hypothetical protein
VRASSLSRAESGGGPGAGDGGAAAVRVGAPPLVRQAVNSAIRALAFASSARRLSASRIKTLFDVTAAWLSCRIFCFCGGAERVAFWGMMPRRACQNGNGESDPQGNTRNRRCQGGAAAAALVCFLPISRELPVTREAHFRGRGESGSPLRKFVHEENGNRHSAPNPSRSPGGGKSRIRRWRE